MSGTYRCLVFAPLDRTGVSVLAAVTEHPDFAAQAGVSRTGGATWSCCQPPRFLVHATLAASVPRALQTNTHLVHVTVSILYLRTQRFRNVSKLASVFTAETVLSGDCTKLLPSSSKRTNIRFVSHQMLGSMFQCSGREVSIYFMGDGGPITHMHCAIRIY